MAKPKNGAKTKNKQPAHSDSRKRVAVEVIDDRCIESLKVISLA